MDSFDDDSHPPPRPAAGGNNPDSRGSTGSVGFFSPPPPAAPQGEEGGLSSNSPPRQQQQQQQQGGSSVYDLFLTAVGLTPRGLGADAFSPGAPGVQAEEEDFWSAIEDGEEDVPGAGAGAGAAGGADHGNTLAALHPTGQQQPQRSAAAATAMRSAVPVVGTGGGAREDPSNDQLVRTDHNDRAAAAAAAAIAAEPTGATQTGAASAVGGRDTHAGTVGGHRPESDMRRRHPSEGLNTPAGGTSLDAAVGTMHAATVAAGTARRRRGPSGSSSAAELESGMPVCCFHQLDRRCGGGIDLVFVLVI